MPVGGGPVATSAPVSGPQGAETTLTEVDISDPAAMTIARTMSVPGSYVSARLAGGSARVVLNSPSQVAAQDGVREFVPQTVLRSRITNRTFRRTLVPCDAVRHPARFSGLDLLTILTVDLDRGLFKVDRDGVLAGAQTVYASDTSLYVASQRYVRGLDRPDEIPPRMTTEIHRFDTTKPDVTTYRATGSVPGFVLNQFALSEYRGDLRVASTEEPQWMTDPNAGAGLPGREGQSGVSVLRERGTRLETLARVDGLGTGERIYAVRFLGDAGYVVTFRQTDPLYTLDLADPERPRVRGELKLTGYSAYLHPLGGDLLLGVGQEATTAGRRLGAQVSLFDVADLRTPRRLQRHALGGPGSSSSAEFDHHAFLWWNPAQTVVLPLDSWSAGDGGAAFTGAVGLRVRRAQGIEELGRVTHARAEDGWSPPVRRSMVVGDRLLTLSDRGIASSRLATLAPIGFTAFPVPEPSTAPGSAGAGG